MIYIWGFKSFTSALFLQTWKKLFIIRQIKNLDFPTFVVQKDFECVTSYIQTEYKATVKRNLQAQYQKTPSACFTILRRLESLNNAGSVKNRSSRWGPLPSEQMVQMVNFCFCQASTRSRKRKVAYFGTPNFNIRKHLRKLAHMFL